LPEAESEIKFAAVILSATAMMFAQEESS